MYCKQCNDDTTQQIYDADDKKRFLNFIGLLAIVCVCASFSYSYHFQNSILRIV